MQSASASGQVAVVPYFPSGSLSFVSLSGGRRAAATLVRCCQPTPAAFLIGQCQAAGVYKVPGEPTTLTERRWPPGADRKAPQITLHAPLVVITGVFRLS